jgi:hypothetical protein
VFTKLLGLNYRIIYKKGVDNTIVDVLGMQDGGHRDSRARAHPHSCFLSRPSRKNIHDASSPILQGGGGTSYAAKPWLLPGGGSPVPQEGASRRAFGARPLDASKVDIGIIGASKVQCKMTWHGGHVSCSHLWGVETYVNPKVL